MLNLQIFRHVAFRYRCTDKDRQIEKSRTLIQKFISTEMHR